MPLVPIEETQVKRRLVPIEEEQAQLEQPRRGFFNRMGSDIERRIGNLGDIYGTEQTTPSKLYQTVGQGFATAGDVMGNLAMSGYGMLPESVRHPIESGMGAIGDVVSDIGDIRINDYETVGDRTKSFLGALSSDYATQREMYPETVRNIEATANIAPFFMFGGKTRAAGKTLKSFSDDVANTIDDIAKKAPNMSHAEFKRVADKAYQLADRSGAVMPPKVLGGVLDDFSARRVLTPEAEVVSKGLASKTGQSYVDDVVKSLEPLKGKPIGIKAFNEIDQKLSDVLYGNKDYINEMSGELLAPKQAIKELQESLRDKVLSLTKEEAGSAGFEALAKARELWKNQIKVREIESIIRKAEWAQQPATAIKTGFKQLAESKRFKNLFNEAEREIINKAKNSGKTAEIFAMFGSRLPSTFALGMGDVATGTLLRAGSGYGRKAALNYQLQNAQDLINQIGGISPQPAMNKALGNVAKMTLATPPRLAGYAMQSRAPQLTTLGVLNEQFTGEQ